MRELKEIVTGEPIGDINGAAITSGVGPANEPTNSRTKRDALYKPLFENYFTSEAVRNQMAKALLDELSPHFISAFMLRGEGASNVTARTFSSRMGKIMPRRWCGTQLRRSWTPVPSRMLRTVEAI
jgi:hypothetical protein